LVAGHHTGRAEAEADLKQYPASYSLEIVEVPRNVDGLFMEELQSDRHQAGRERGYEGDIKPISAEENKRLFLENVIETSTQENIDNTTNDSISKITELIKNNMK
jgi:hypothetical protein